MSKIKENVLSNIERSSSKLIIISKKRLGSAKITKNYITLKDGEHKLIFHMENDNNINNNLKQLKKEILINSKSYGELSEKSSLNNYLKKKKILKTPCKQIENEQKKKPKTFVNINVETIRSCQLMKTIENYKNINEEEDNKIETNAPCDIINTKEKNCKEKINLKQNIIIKKIKRFNENDNNDNYKIKNNNDNHIDIIDISSKDDNDYGNKNVNIPNIGVISRNYFINSKYNSKSKDDNLIDNYKSEVIKNEYSDLSRNKENINVKNNNFIERNIQRSDKAAKSFSEQESDKKTKIVSKLVLDSIRINQGESNKENYMGPRLITENDTQYIKDNLISESKSSKTINVDENDEFEEDEKNNINNNIKNKNNNENKVNFNTKNYLFEDKKDSNHNLEDEFDNDNNNINNLNQFYNLTIKKMDKRYKTCNICEHTLPISKLFTAECQKHFLCGRCTKMYYEEIIENGGKEMICPFTKCKQPVDLEILKKFISYEHYNNLINNKNNKETLDLNKNNDKKKLDIYMKRNVIDINSNNNFYNYNKFKKDYCPICYKKSLYLKTDGIFYYKCLNCMSKICKYCLKQYNIRHMDSSYIDHCKIYYRVDEETKNCNCILIYLLQIIFILACFYLCIAATFIFIKKLFFFLFQTDKRNILLYILVYFFIIILFFIILPFILILFPYFPLIMALTDY